ncbi:MAG: DNA polymerase III subunit gamma/tau [Verrucomicrobiae bacterium]|nr:DNA polymerase III subunit gamma/tau [Verrucomicrobiae bacterium]
MASYQVLARKYRPQTFDEVIGQDHIVQTLKNAISQNRLAHAYLFVGPRGTGKTSTARILAKSLNCKGGPRVDYDPDDEVVREITEGRCLDVIEIDGASNNGVEQVRDLRDNVRYAPAHGKFKVYIIDEVHMLTTAAFNALLKTLEEPPEHVKFVFATTEPQKVLPTILSRCQRFDLKPIPARLIVAHLAHICTLEKVTITPEALEAIARGAEGGMRDAESALDQLISFCGNTIAEEDVLRVFGLASQRQIADLSAAILRGEAAAALDALEAICASGKDLIRVLGDLLEHFRHLLLIKVTGQDPEGLPDATLSTLKTQAGLADSDTILRVVDIFVASEYRIKTALSKKIFFEITLIKAVKAREFVPLETVLKQLNELKDGTFTAPSAPPAPAASAPVRAAAPAAAATPVSSAPSSPTPASSEPSPQNAPEGTGSGGGDFAEAWARVGEAFAGSRPLLKTIVQEARPVSLENDCLTVSFASAQSFHIDQLKSASNSEFIRNTLSTYFARPITVKFVLRPPEDSPAPAAAPTVPVRPREAAAPAAKPPVPTKPDFITEAPPRTTGPRTEEELKSDPLIRKALELFRGRILEIKRTEA